MKREELVGALRQPYSEERGFGTQKVDKAGYENIWFIIPPKPPHDISETLSLPLLRDANLALQARSSLQSASEIEQTTAYLLVRREAVSSSRMEGTWSTVDEVLSPANGDAGRSASASVRGGRMLWTLQMVVAGRLPLYLSSYVEAERTEYGEALQEAQKQLSYRRIIDFVCHAIITSTEEETVTQQTLQSLPQLWQERGRFRRRSSAARALELLLRMPVLTAKLLADELNVSLPAANEGIKRLEKSGVVRDRSGRGRRRIYAAEEVINLLSRPFGADIDVALEGARSMLRISSS
jgi:Fic family protein